MNKAVKLVVNAAIAMAMLQPELLSVAKKVYHTRRINSSAPVNDGQLDDPAWQTAPWGRNFFQKQPYEGARPSQDTAFKILYDEENLYVGIRAFGTEPGKIVKRMTRRDDRDGDWVEIIFDSYFDHRTGFAFSVNAAGVKTETLISENGSNWDDSYDPIWYVKTAIDTKGWSAEMRIPLTQLRFGGKENHTWGLYMSRSLHRKQETCEWQLILRKVHVWVSLFGELQDLNGIKPKRPIELLLYSLGKLQHFEPEEGNPFVTCKFSSAALGLDGKIGITNDLNLDFSVNPDFGQVEAYPLEVNLIAFETFFPKKRPFFIEGRNILDYQVSDGDGPYAWDYVFYSRRIGRTPQHEPGTGDNEYVHSPENTAILAAFKLTGKTRKGLSSGIMESVTAREYAETDINGKRGTLIVEPLTNYFIMRLHKDYNRGNTGIGGIFTTTNHSLENVPHLNYLYREVYTGGLDFFHYWKNKEWEFSIKTVFSQVKGGTYKPAHALSLSLESNYSDLRNDLQYVDSAEKDSLQRYVFAHIRHKTLGITLPLNSSITPKLSIQFYGLPFISSGKYTAFKFITQPRTAAYDNRFHLYAPGEIYYDDSELCYFVDEPSGANYSFEDTNFKFLQFRSNRVVRWEYTPGSTLYLVWSQGRTDTFTDDFGFSPSGGIRDLFRIHPHDVFLVNFTYRFKI